MIEPQLSASVEANVSIQPAQSQTFLVSLLGLSAISITCGAILLGLEMPAGWAFVALSTLPLGGAVACWWKSQPDVDSVGAHPTTITRPDGGVVTTDLRAIRSPQVLQNLSQLAHGILTTQPLPIADGRVDRDLNIVPDSKEEARAITEQINDTTQAITNNLIDALNLSEGGTTVAPVFLEHADRNG